MRTEHSVCSQSRSHPSSVFLSYVYLYGLPTALLCTNLVYNGSSDLRQLHKQDNIPPLIIHRAFRLVILILYFPLVRICQYHPDNWTLNGEISRQDPSGCLSNYHIDFKPERIELPFIMKPRLANYQNEYNISK